MHKNFFSEQIARYRLLSICIFSFILLSLTACEKNNKEEINKVTKKEVPTEEATNVEIMYSDSAKLKATLKAPKMIRYLSDTNPTIVMPNSLQTFFYDNNGKSNAMLRANYGIRYVYRNLTFVKGNVIVVNLKGDSLFAEELTWQQDKERIFTDKFVKVKTPKEIILAEGFESDQTFSNYKFYKVKATMEISQ